MVDENNFLDYLGIDLEKIEGNIGYIFSDKRLLAQALIHSSFYNENQTGCLGHNERLEFLGDSVLGVIVASYLYKNFPDFSEGHLSHLRAQLVGADACVYYVKQLHITSFVLMGKGEVANQGKGRDRILSDFFEAIIGALYLDGGIGVVESFFLSHFSTYLEQTIKDPIRNWKAELQDFAQKKFQKPPEYVVLEEKGLPHQKIFTVVVFIEGKEWGKGEGTSKKLAEQAAAEEAWKKVEEEKKSDGQT